MRRIRIILSVMILFALAAFACTVQAEETRPGAVSGMLAEEESGSQNTASQTGGPLIRSFTMEEAGNGIYRAEWDIANVSETVYVQIYAAQSRDDFTGVLTEGIESGTHGSVDVYMPDIDSGWYLFYMSATSMNGTAGYKFADDFFFYDNINRAEKLEGVSMCREKNELYVLWEDGRMAKAVLYDADTGELLSESEPQYAPCTVTLPKGHRAFLAGAVPMEYGIPGRFETVDTGTLKSSAAEIIMPDEQVTGSSRAQITVRAEENYSLRIFRNGTETESVSDTDGVFTIELSEGENELIAVLTDEKGRMRAAQTALLSDTIPPELLLTGQTDEIQTVEEEITLKGHVDPDAELTYLGESVELAGGNFYLRKPLGFGKNQFVLTAADRAGNVTERTVNVERVFWSLKNILLILLVLAVAAICVIELFLLFYKPDRKRRPKENESEPADPEEETDRNTDPAYPAKEDADIAEGKTDNTGGPEDFAEKKEEPVKHEDQQ